MTKTYFILFIIYMGVRIMLGIIGGVFVIVGTTITAIDEMTKKK